MPASKCNIKTYKILYCCIKEVLYRLLRETAETQSFENDSLKSIGEWKLVQSFSLDIVNPIPRLSFIVPETFWSILFRYYIWKSQCCRSYIITPAVVYYEFTQLRYCCCYYTPISDFSLVNQKKNHFNCELFTCIFFLFCIWAQTLYTYV